MIESVKNREHFPKCVCIVRKSGGNWFLSRLLFRGHYFQRFPCECCVYVRMSVGTETIDWKNFRKYYQSTTALIAFIPYTLYSSGVNSNSSLCFKIFPSFFPDSRTFHSLENFHTLARIFPHAHLLYGCSNCLLWAVWWCCNGEMYHFV